MTRFIYHDVKMLCIYLELLSVGVCQLCDESIMEVFLF